MRRSVLILLLGFGVLLGFGSGLRQLRWHHSARRAAFERHVADVCVDAARSGRVPPPPAPGTRSGPGPSSGW
jgi:hypothetical protein